MLLQNPIITLAFSAHPAQIHEATISLTEKFREIVTPGLCWVVVPAGRQEVVGRMGLAAHSSCLWSCVAVWAELKGLFPLGAERCRWSPSQSTSRLMCVHSVFPYYFSFSWECFPGRCFIEGVQVFQWLLSAVSFILPSLAWCVYLVIVGCQECMAVMTEECIGAANSSEYWEITGSLCWVDGINP